MEAGENNQVSGENEAGKCGVCGSDGGEEKVGMVSRRCVFFTQLLCASHCADAMEQGRKALFVFA